MYIRCWPTETRALLKENQRQRSLAGQVSVAPSLLRDQLLPHYEQHVNAKHVWRHACLNEQTYITPAYFTKVATSNHKHRHKLLQLLHGDIYSEHSINNDSRTRCQDDERLWHPAPADPG